MNITKAQTFDAVRLQAPPGATSVHHKGFDFEVENGHVLVPSDAVELLRAHGFKDAVHEPESVVQQSATQDEAAVQTQEPKRQDQPRRR